MRTTATTIALSALVMSAALAPAPTARAQTVEDLYPELQTLTAAGGAELDRLGFAVSMSSDTLVVGVPFADAERGRVRIYGRSGDMWLLQQTLTAFDREDFDAFGFSLSLSGDTLAVGVVGDDGFKGSVRMFTRAVGIWTEQATLTAPEGVQGDNFGAAISLSGDTLVVGAPADTVGANSDQGSAHVFVRTGTNWTRQAVLTASNGATGDQFGSSVAVLATGRTIAIGVPRDDVNGVVNQGSVRIFGEFNGIWSELETLTHLAGAAEDQFGYSVSLSGMSLAVGVPFDDVNGAVDQGTVRLFRQGQAVYEDYLTLTAAQGAAGDLFGFRVSLRGDLLAATAPYDDIAGVPDRGSVRVFMRKDEFFQERPILRSSTGPAGQQFGLAVALSDDMVAVGAPLEDVGTNLNQGAVFVFGNDWIRNATRGTFHPSIASAVASGFWGDRLIVGARPFTMANGVIDASDKRFTFTAVEEVTLGANSLLQVATGTIFERSPATPLGEFLIAGKLVAPENGTLTFDRLSIVGNGQFLQRGSTVLVNAIFATWALGVSYLDGRVLAEVVSTSVNGQIRVAGDTDVFANYNNAGATVIQRGILYIYGTLTNTGTITGEFNNGFLPPNPGDGYSIGGDYIVSAESSIVLPDPVWWLRIGGSFDVAIDSPSRFVMDQATLELSGVGPKGGQSVEVLSRDLGDAEAGFANTNYPLGAMRLRAGATVELVDNHDNAPGKAAEAVYAKNLVVPAGAALVTNGLKVYTRAATIQGAVSDPDDIIVVPGIPPCAADLFPNGEINAGDLGVLLSEWGPCSASCIADLDGDGMVGATDLAILLSSWGPCAD